MFKLIRFFLAASAAFVLIATAKNASAACKYYNAAKGVCTSAVTTAIPYGQVKGFSGSSIEGYSGPRIASRVRIGKVQFIYPSAAKPVKAKKRVK